MERLPDGSCEEKEVYEMAMSPFRGFYDMQGEMNRMLDEVFGNLDRSGGRQLGDQPTRWAPARVVL